MEDCLEEAAEALSTTTKEPMQTLSNKPKISLGFITNYLNY